MTLRIATRESPLAMWQARHVAQLLAGHGIPTQIIPLVSSGDVDMRPIDGTRSVGVFTKRIQQALWDGQADVAVHSLKDLPTEDNPTLVLAAVPARETPEDVLVSPLAVTLDQIRQGGVVGTGSFRRTAQLRHVRPDLDVRPIRGNVQTRLAKLNEGQFDAIVLAEAGLQRLAMNDVPRVILPLDLMLPAPGQGALGIEVRSDDPAAIEAVKRINDPASELAVTAERIVLRRLHGGCLAPIAVHAVTAGDRFRITAAVLAVDGSRRIDHAATIDLTPEDHQTRRSQIADLARSISDELIRRGAADLIRN